MAEKIRLNREPISASLLYKSALEETFYGVDVTHMGYAGTKQAMDGP